MSLTIDSREFGNALKEYFRVVKNKTLPEIINKKAFHIAGRAFALTHVPDADAIREALMKRSFAQGWAGGRYAPTAGVIVQKATRLKEGKGFTPSRSDSISEHRQKVEAFVRKRISHRMFMRSGWIGAIRAFAKVIRPDRPERKSRIKTIKGGAKTAKPGINPTAEMWNEALSKTTKHFESLYEFAGIALETAIREETSDMISYTAKKMQEISDQHSAR